MDTEEPFTVNLCHFEGALRDNYFGEEQKLELKWKRVKMLKVPSKDEVVWEMIKSEDGLLIG